ncbi:VWA domain-containing protein [Pseudochelatococcus sp. B33]
MSFIAPVWLALLALLPVVLALHTRARRAVVVPGLMLWKRVQGVAGWTAAARRRPRPNALLLLQLLAVLLAALALARPLWGPGGDADHIVIVLDTSASMQTRSGSSTRFGEALERLARFAATGNGAARVSLVTTGIAARPVIARQPFRPEVLRGAIDEVEATEGAADVAGLSALLTTLLRAGETTRIVSLSDAPLPHEAAEAAGGAAVDTIIVGTPASNKGLNARLVPVAPEDGRWTVEGAINRASGPEATAIAVKFTPAGQTAARERQRLEVSGASSFAAELDLPGAGVVELALPEDAADFDNRVRFVVTGRPQTMSILHIGPGGQPLVEALQAVGGVEVQQASALPDDLDPFDLIVIDNTQVPRRPEVSSLWIGDAGVAGEGLRPLPGGTLDQWDGSHALTGGIDWSALQFEAAASLTPLDGAVTLLAAQGHPALTARTTPEGGDIHLAFDPRRSNWARQPSLVLFAANLVEWLGFQPGGFLAPACVVGTECAVPRHFSGGTLTRMDASNPDGGDAPARAIAASRFVPERAGLFGLEHNGRTALLAVNPARTDESAVDASGAQPTPPSDTTAPAEITAAFIIVLLVVLLAEGVLFRRRQGRSRRLPWLRVAILALVLLALFDPPLPFPSRREATVAILDPGMRPADAAIAPDAIVVINSAIPQIADGSTTPPAGAAFRGDMAAALQLAAALLPRDGVRRILMPPPLAHEADTAGALVTALARRGVAFSPLAPAGPMGETGVSSVEAPSPVYAGDSFALTLKVHAAAAAPATVHITRNDEPLGDLAIALQAGANRIDIPVMAERAGETFFNVSLSVADHPQTGNETNGVWVTVRQPARIAVISPQAGKREEFARMLREQGLDAITLEPRAAPARTEDWLAYDGIVLMNVPAIALETRRQTSLEEAVRDHGRGLFLLGGPDSFGPGGYLATPLERLSPLSSRIPRDVPETALVFVLDRSGSMLQTVGTKTRLDIAKQAVMAAAGLLDARSRMGIVMFSADAETVFPLQPVNDPAEVARALAGVRAGGGTAIYPGLVSAYSQLRDNPAAARHVVVMTDGMSDLADFQTLLGNMRAEGITVSTIAIGSTAETSIAEDIARLGGGAFHASGDFEALPSIISQETLLSASSPIEEITTQPLRVATDEPFLAGLPERLPPVHGFVRTTAKPQVHLSWIVLDERQEPVPFLATWRYGLGQVLAVAGDGMGPWSRAWEAMDDYPRLWSQAMRQFLPVLPQPGLDITARRIGDRIDVRVTEAARSDEPPVLTMKTADGQEQQLPLTGNVDGPAETGAWQASFFPETAGDIALSAGAGESEAGLRLHIARSVSRDQPDNTVDLPSLLLLSGSAGGGTDTTARSHWQTVRAWPFFLVLALVLFMLELAYRHTGSPAGRIPRETRKHSHQG